MDIAALQAFVAVAEEVSFSMAADRLYLTQPAVSKRIAALETELEARLFDRIGRKTALTEAGRALLPRARRILAEVEDSQRALHNLSGEVSGRLRLGTSHHIGLHRLPPVLRQYTARYPDVDLDLRFMDSEQACRAVVGGDLELAIVTLPPEAQPPLRTTRIWRDPLRIVVGPSHPLASRRRITRDELTRYPAVLPAPGTYTRAVVEDALQTDSFPLHVRLSTNYLETIKMLVSIGLGWSTLPLTMIDQEIAVVSVAGVHLERALGVAIHTERTLSNAALTLARMLQGNT